MVNRADIVVCNYKTYGDLAAFLDSVEKTWSASIASVTVVDVEAQAEGRPWGMPLADVIGWLASTENIGYARACNWGASMGIAEAVVLCNADVMWTEGALDHCLEVLFSEPDIAVVGPRQVDLRRRLTHAGITGGNRNAVPRAFHRPDVGQHVDVEDVTSVAGSAYITKRSVWEEMSSCPQYRRADPGSMGAFLRTPHYYEETWYSYHVRDHGYRVVYDGAVTIIHQWHKASPVGGWAERQMKISQKMFRETCDIHGIEHD